MMIKAIIALLVALAAVVLGEGGYGGYNGGYGGYGYGRSHGYYYPGFKRGHNGISAVYRNDVRQEQVNHIAEHYGAGTGTARFVGVPGTNGYYGYKHYGGYGYPKHGGYGYGHGYGY